MVSFFTVRRCLAYFGWMILSWVSLPAAAAPTFPITISADGRHLEDATGAPFTIQADTPWSLIVQVPLSDVESYLEDRRAKGFTAVIVNLIERAYADRAPNTIGNLAPFTTPGDLGTPNDAYFNYAKNVVEIALQKGLLVLFTPSYFGYGGGSSGWWTEITNSGPAKCYAYGRYLGSLFKQYANIGWIFGGDYSPPSGVSGELNAVEIAKGIRAEDRPDRLYTYHGIRRTNAYDQVAFRPYINLNAVYSGPGAEVYQRCLGAYSAAPLPTFLIEGWYENEHGMTPYQLRLQSYWALTSCTAGQAFGNAPIWYFNALSGQSFADNRTVGWKDALQWPGSLDMQRLAKLIADFRIKDLLPDLNHEVVLSGYGSFGSVSYVTTAATARNLSISYVPQAATITINLGWFANPVNLFWFDPTSGTAFQSSGSPFTNSGNLTVNSPGPNSGGDADWVLIASTGTPTGDAPPGVPRNLTLAP